jgi:hypothetical protein
VNKPVFIALGEHLDRPVATGGRDQPKRTRLEEVDRLFVEEGNDLGLGDFAGFGENVLSCSTVLIWLMMRSRQ